MKEVESLEIYAKSLVDTEKELTTIFNEVMSGNLSLKRKVELRKDALRISLNLFKVLRECLVMGKKELKKEKFTNGIDVFVAMGLTISALVAFVFNPLISLVLLAFAMIKCVTKMNSLKTKLDSSKDDLEQVVAKLDQVSRLMDNIDRRLSLDIAINKETNGELATKNIDLANDIILEYLETGNLKEIDNDTKIYVIKLLQSDLKTDEINIHELLRLAKDKVDKESKEKGIKLVKGE